MSNSNVKYQMSNIKYQISDVKYQISDIKYCFVASSDAEIPELCGLSSSFLQRAAGGDSDGDGSGDWTPRAGQRPP